MQYRRGVAVAPLARAVEQRLVVAGEESLVVAVVAGLPRPEPALEKGARGGAVGRGKIEAAAQTGSQSPMVPARPLPSGSAAADAFFRMGAQERRKAAKAGARSSSVQPRSSAKRAGAKVR